MYSYCKPSFDNIYFYPMHVFEMKHSVGQCLPPIITYRCGFTDTNKHKAKVFLSFHRRGKEMRAITTLFLLYASLFPLLQRNSDFGFYRQSCHCAGSIISKVVANSRDRSITAASLHMQLNDWFVTVRKFSFVIQCHHSGWCP